MNLLRARRALERAPAGGLLEVWLGAEGRDTVPRGLAALGHAIVESDDRDERLRLVVRRQGGAGTASADGDADAWLRRFARQIVLPDLGEAGQRRLGGARVRVEGTGDAADSAATHLRAAGVGDVVLAAPRTERRLELAAGPASVAAPVRAHGPLARFEGAVLADACLRAIVSGVAPTRRIVADDDGGVTTVAV